MNLYGIKILASVIVFQASLLHAAENHGIKGKAETVLSRINKFCSENKLPSWEIDLSKGEEKIHRGTATQGDLLWLYSRGQFSFMFFPSTGGLVECHNLGLEKDGTKTNKKTIELDEAPSQNWSSDYAVELAKKFAQACNGESLKNVGAAKFEFYQERGTYNKATKQARYRVPYWWVILPRVDQNGYEFQMEHVSVKMLEKSGPYWFELQMPSRYELVKGEPLKQEDVMPAALDYAQTLTKRGPIAGMFTNGKINETPASAKLEIVKPNRLADLKELPTSKDIDLNARLAWVIWFEWSNNNPSESRQKGGIAVWIDAHTGQPLGGDAI